MTAEDAEVRRGGVRTGWKLLIEAVEMLVVKLSVIRNKIMKANRTATE